MFICSVTGSYIFGIKLELMVAGCYIGLALDEIVRGLFMLFRWRSKKWMEKSLIK
jgi:Na+-driven multidrug efflux pump